MKLLLDQNISPKLLPALRSSYTETAHVMDAGLDCARVEEVRKFASERGFAIVTKIRTFHSGRFRAVLLPKSSGYEQETVQHVKSKIF